MPWLYERSFLLNGVLLIFCQPVYLHFQLADFLVEIGNEGFFAFGLPTFSCREQVWQTIKGLLLPLRDLGGMNSVLSGDLIGRFLPFDGFYGHLCLQRCAVSFALSCHRFLLLGFLSIQLFYLIPLSSFLVHPHLSCKGTATLLRK